MAVNNLNIYEIIEDYEAGESASSIARRNGVSTWSILARLRKAGIVIRQNQNERRLGSSSTDKFTFKELVDGILLGDGQIDKKGLLHLEQTISRIEWIKDVQLLIKQSGGSSKIIDILPRCRHIEGRDVKSKPAVRLYTPAFVCLKKQRKRWYPNGIKRIPKDLRLTPVLVTQWFCGDGTYNSNGTLSICTNGFLERDTDFLIHLIERDLNVYSKKTKTSRPGQFVIGIYHRNEAMKLRNIVFPWMPNCCLYKFRFVRAAKNPHLLPNQVQEIRNFAMYGYSPEKIAKRFNRSVQTIRNIINDKSYKAVCNE